MERVHDSMWCGIVLDQIVGPFFFHEGTSEVYLDMLENFVFPQIVAEVDSLIFQHSATAHFGAIVCTALGERFPDQWISRGVLIYWPL
jgi:hypothetical protein